MVETKVLDIAFRVGPFPKLSETFVLDQIKGMLERGHRVSVLADEPGDIAPGHGDLAWLSQLRDVTYVSPTNAVVKALSGILPYRLHLSRRNRLERRLCEDHDIVICNFGWFGESVMSNAPANCRAKIITIFHGADMSSSVLEAGKVPYPALLSRGDLLLPISDFWRRRLLDAGAEPSRVAIHRMGVDLGAFVFEARKPASDRPFRFISVCRFVEKKGMAYALRACADLAARNDQPAFVFEIVGSGPLQNELVTLRDELGLQDVVTFAGERPHHEVAKALQSADAFVLPSVVAANGDMEGIPVSLMEAMASGLPVISTRHSGISELITDGVNGLLADERDVAGLADAMARIMSDPVVGTSLARAARDTVAARFNSQKLNDQLSRFASALNAGHTDVRAYADEPVAD